MAGQHLFRLHHAQAQRASRRLSAVFWLGVLLSAGIYFALGMGVVELFRFIVFHAQLLDEGWQIHRYSWYSGATVASCCIAVVIGEYYAALHHLQRHSAAELAVKMLAKPIESEKHHARFAMLTNIVEEMALAGGMRTPPVFYLPRDDSINAFVLGGKGQSVALVVSNGLIDYLNRDEQQAIIAHEFGHIKNEDVFIYAKLSAVLKGYYAISEWRHGDAIVSVAREHIFSGLFRREDGQDTPLDLIRRLLGITGLILAMIGERIQTAFSREREWMADALAVQYTRNPAALVMAFKKALALQLLQMRPYAMPSNLAHYLFINYFQQMRTHPPLNARIARYGGIINPQEIEALAYDIRQKRLQSATDNPIEINRQSFINNAIFPILIVQRAQQTLNQLPLSMTETRLKILAFFLYHSGMDSLSLAQSSHIAESDKAPLSQAFLWIKHLAPLEHFNYFQQLARHYFAQARAEDKAALWQQIKRIMQADGQLNFYEICYAAAIQYLAQSPSSHQHYRDQASAIYQILSLVASLSRPLNAHSHQQSFNAEEIQQAQKHIYAQLLKQSLPLEPQPLQSIDENAAEHMIALHQSLRSLSELHSTYRQSLWQTLNHYWQRQAQLSLKEVHLRQLLELLLQP